MFADRFFPGRFFAHRYWPAVGATASYTPAPSIRTFYPRELDRTLDAPGEVRTFYPRYDPTLDGAP